jgi:hypothetical protein
VDGARRVEQIGLATAGELRCYVVIHDHGLSLSGPGVRAKTFSLS